PDNVKKRLGKQIDSFGILAIGPTSLAELRKNELARIAQAGQLLAVNVRVSGDLTKEVNRLVADANLAIVNARSQASAVQALNRQVLVVVVILSLVSSVLIVWLYVGRNLIRRL